MKRLIKNKNSIINFVIEVIVDIVEKEPGGLVATTYKGTEIPYSEPLPSDKKALIDSQALEDYHSFIKSVEELLADYYSLEIYYKNNSETNSSYFGTLAKDRNNNLVLNFDFTLRVSTHPAKRTSESQNNKKERKKALLEVTEGKKTKPITRSILVNNEQFVSYLDAFKYIDSEVGEIVDTMLNK